MKILLCLGTRPEAIKMAPVFHFLKKEFTSVKICVTAQHRQMLDQVLDFFDIVPDYDLDLMQPNQTLNELCANIIKNIDTVLEKENPDMVLVHGDTTTSSMVALAAFHRKIKIGHIEAGLRTYDKFSPFPEEMNRQITSKLADWHFAPTQWAVNNLINERISQNRIINTGNTVIDALHLGLQKLQNGYENQEIEDLKNIINPNKKLIVVTGHRRENFGQGFENLCTALTEIAQNNDVQIIYPVHLNPNVQEPVQRILSNYQNIFLINPLSYPAFLYLMSISYCILTDSGGVQEEAPSLGKPVLVMRETTERPEAVEAGTVKLVGTNTEIIVKEVVNLLQDSNHYTQMSIAHNPYGDGKASERIVKFIKNNR